MATPVANDIPVFYNLDSGRYGTAEVKTDVRSLFDNFRFTAEVWNKLPDSISNIVIYDNLDAGPSVMKFRQLVPTMGAAIKDGSTYYIYLNPEKYQTWQGKAIPVGYVIAHELAHAVTGDGFFVNRSENNIVEFINEVFSGFAGFFPSGMPDNVNDIRSYASDQLPVYVISPRCFPAATSVMMADGLRKVIKDIEVGDVVMAYNPTPGFLSRQEGVVES